jgi:hypothetical protein
VVRSLQSQTPHTNCFPALCALCSKAPSRTSPVEAGAALHRVLVCAIVIQICKCAICIMKLAIERYSSEHHLPPYLHYSSQPHFCRSIAQLDSRAKVESASGEVPRQFHMTPAFGYVALPTTNPGQCPLQRPYRCFVSPRLRKISFHIHGVLRPSRSAFVGAMPAAAIHVAATTTWRSGGFDSPFTDGRRFHSTFSSSSTTTTSLTCR